MTTNVVDSQTDLAILRRIAKKDPAAVGELYDTYAGPLYALVLRIVRDKGFAEDTLQEIFLRVWERAGSYDESPVRHQSG